MARPTASPASTITKRIGHFQRRGAEAVAASSGIYVGTRRGLWIFARNARAENRGVRHGAACPERAAPSVQLCSASVQGAAPTIQLSQLAALRANGPPPRR